MEWQTHTRTPRNGNFYAIRDDVRDLCLHKLSHTFYVRARTCVRVRVRVCVCLTIHMIGFLTVSNIQQER